MKKLLTALLLTALLVPGCGATEAPAKSERVERGPITVTCPAAITIHCPTP